MTEVDENLRAWWAVKSMSEEIGADLSKELRQGRIDLETISDIVLKCEDCHQAGACKKALRSGLGVSEALKAQCPNRATFETHARKPENLAQ